MQYIRHAAFVSSSSARCVLFQYIGTLCLSPVPRREAIVSSISARGVRFQCIVSRHSLPVHRHAVFVASASPRALRSFPVHLRAALVHRHSAFAPSTWARCVCCQCVAASAAVISSSSACSVHFHNISARCIPPPQYIDALRSFPVHPYVGALRFSVYVDFGGASFVSGVWTRCAVVVVVVGVEKVVCFFSCVLRCHASVFSARAFLLATFLCSPIRCLACFRLSDR